MQVKTMIGTILRCGVDGQLCPFNWDILADGAQYVDYIKDNCPIGQYRKRDASKLICDKAERR